MSEERVFKKAITWLLLAFLLFAAIQYLSKVFPDFEAYGLPILGAFVVAAVYDVQRKRRGKES